jgi:hypothetical protein
MLTLKLWIENRQLLKKRSCSISEYVQIPKEFPSPFQMQVLLRDYGLALEKRSETEKKSATGRQETILYGQMRAYLKPFFVDLQTQVTRFET